MRLWLLLFLLPIASAQIVPGYDQLPDPNEYDSCDVEPQLFANLPVGIENLHFLNGTLYLTAFGNGLWQATPDGNVSQIVATTSRPGTGPTDDHGAMMGVTSFDGALYVSQGMSLITPVDGRILRFAVPGEPEFTVFAEGFDGVNGMTADGEGNLYVAHGFGQGVYKVTPDGQWTLWKDLPSANGVSAHPDGKRVVLAAAFVAGGRIIAVPFDNPATEETLFTFNAVSPLGAEADPSKAVVPKLFDDIAVAANGRVLAASHERLHSVMGDPDSGEACVATVHDASVTSVRIAHEFGPWDGWAFVTDNGGSIWTFPVEEPVLPSTSNAPGSTTEDTPNKSMPLPLWIVPVALFLGGRR